MEIGATLTGRPDERLYRAQVQVALSDRMELDALWNYDLFSPFWRVYVNNRSGASIIHRGRTIPLSPRRLYLIPAWVRFHTAITRPVTQRYIHFYLAGFPPTLLRRVFDQPILLKPEGALGELSRRWQRGFDEEPKPAHHNWAYALVHASLALAMESLSQTDQSDCFRWLTDSHAVRPALECIDQRLAQPPDNSELAALCHSSTDHFIRQFRSIVGMTPARYGLERRVAVAAQWLTGTERSIEEIAEGTGFTDRFHLSRVFKDQLGLPPASYRQLHHTRS